MHVHQLETFLWVAALKSFRAAASRLNLTQPAISARIAALEEELGIQLLSRRGREVTLTQEGVTALRYAEEVLRLTRSLKNELPDLGTNERTVRIGIVETLAYAWLPALMQRVEAGFHGINIEIVTDSTANLQRALSRHEIDVVFIFGISYEPNARCVWLAQHKLRWIASPALGIRKRKLALTDLARYPIITYEEGTQVHFELKMLFKANGAWPVRLVGCNGVGTLVDLVREGHGIGVLPAETVRREIDRGDLVVLTSGVALAVFDVFVCYPVDSPSAIGRSIAEMGRQVCEALSPAQIPRKPAGKRSPLRSRSARRALPISGNPMSGS
jgi:DNA-binding transcriptional LysR family regulator